MLPILLLVLGSATITLQETTTGDTEPTTFTTVQFTAEETFPTTLNLPQRPHKTVDPSTCKNHFLCNLQKKSTLSKGFPPVPSKNLVPPFTDSEEEELRTTEDAKTTLFDSETETPRVTTLIFKSPTFGRSSITPVVVQKRDNPIGRNKAEATNELRSYLPPLSPAPAQIDLSYLPPQGVLPAAAAASLDISRVNFQPPLEESPAAAQTDARQVKPDGQHKDICSDAFHSFLCTPLKSRKRITGALPNSITPNQGFNPAPSNTVQNAVRPSSTTPRPSPTTPPYAPQPSNVDRSYLPPVPKPIDASPSFNSVRVAHAKDTPSTTTRKPFTSTPRPFIQTSIIPYIAPKVIEQINLLPSTTTKRPTTTTTTPRPTTTTRRPTTTTPAVRLYPEPSNEINRGYLPPATTTKRPFVQLSAVLPTFRQKPKPPSVQIITEATKRVTTTTPRYSPAPATVDRSYLPPDPNFQTAAAAQAGNRVLPPVSPAPASQNLVAAAQNEHHEHHDHHHHHHGNICEDPFHAFLCTPLKARKRITGALPPGFNPQSSNRKETRLRPQSTPKPEPSLSPENTFQSETRVKPTEEVPAANALVPQSVGYQYPKPSVGFPLPSQTSGQFVRPTTPRPTTPRPTPPRPTTPRPTPPRPTSPRPTTPAPVTGYNYPRPSNPFPLPSQQNVEVVPKEDRLSPVVASPQGYQYPKPSVPFPLPSQQQPQRLPSTISRPLSPQPSSTAPPKTSTTTSKPLQPQPSDQRTGYQYPKPSQSLPLPSGYQYPKPTNQLILPEYIRFGSISTPEPTARDFGSAEFIPVNKIDAKRQVSETGLPKGSPRFGERIRSRVRQLGIARIF